MEAPINRLIGSLVVLVVLLGGCGEGDRSTTGGTSGDATPRGDALAISVTLSKTTCVVGEVPEIQVTLRNRTKQDQRIDAMRFSSPGIDMAVTYNGERIKVTAFDSTPMGMETLGAGASKVLTIPFPALQVGTYEIEAHFHGDPQNLIAAPVTLKVEPLVKDGKKKDRVIAVIHTDEGRIELKLDVDPALREVFLFAYKVYQGAYDDAVLAPPKEDAEPGIVQLGSPGTADGTLGVYADFAGIERRTPAEKGSVALGGPTRDAPDATFDAARLMLFTATPEGNVPSNPVIGKVIHGMWVLEGLRDKPLKVEKITFVPW